MSGCRCETVESLEGRDGQDYARAHLDEVTVDQERWLVLHRCPVTKLYWRESFPHSDEHGGGSPLFERITEEQATKEFRF